MLRTLFTTTVLGITLSATAPAQNTALVGATIIDGTGGPAFETGVVLIDGDRLACVGTALRCAVPAGAAVVDVAGRFITPGLVDAHVHFSQTGWLDGRPDGINAPALYPYAQTARALQAEPERWFRSYLCSGITAVFDVGGHPWTTTLPARTERDPTAPHVRAAGPLITHASVPVLQVDDEIYTFLPMSTPQEAKASVARVAAMGVTAVKVWYLVPPVERRATLDTVLMEIGATVRNAGLDLIVHATGLREAKVALRAGATMLVHSVMDTLVDDEFLALMATNDAIYAPTLVVAGNWGRAMASVILDTPIDVNEPNGCVDPRTIAKIADTESLRDYLPEQIRSPEAVFSRLEATGAIQWVTRENLRRVSRAGITVATATDAGNPLTLHGPSIYQEMDAMVQAGVSPEEIIVMSTRNGARAMGRLDDFGTLEPGKLADLLVLPEDPRRDVAAFRKLTHVMRAGVLHRRDSLAYHP